MFLKSKEREEEKEEIKAALSHSDVFKPFRSQKESGRNLQSTFRQKPGAGEEPKTTLCNVYTLLLFSRSFLSLGYPPPPFHLSSLVLKDGLGRIPRRNPLETGHALGRANMWRGNARGSAGGRGLSHRHNEAQTWA